MPVAAIGLGVGLVGSIGKLIAAGKANSSLNQLVGQDPTYTANPIASQRLGLATALLNARAPGVAPAEARIQGNQAAQINNIGRNATSGAQALAAGSAAQGTTNQAEEGLSEQEAQDYQRRYANLAGAQEGMIQEGNKAYEARVRQFEDLAQIRGAQNANRQNAWQSVSNLGLSFTNFGLAGGYKRLFPGGGNNPPAASNQPYAPIIPTSLANTSQPYNPNWQPTYINPNPS